MLPTVVADGGSDGVVPRPVRQVKDGLNGMPQLPPLPPPPRCTYLVRGTRRCKRFAETADRDVCTEHSPEVRISPYARSMAVPDVRGVRSGGRYPLICPDWSVAFTCVT